MKNYLPHLVLLTGCGALVAPAATIHFDSLSAGTPITNQFAGVTFSGFTAGTQTFGGIILTVSSPVYAAMSGAASITFDAPQETVSFTVNGLQQTGSNGDFLNGLTATAYYSATQVGVSQTVNPAGGVAGRPNITLTFSGPITSLSLSAIVSPFGSGGLVIDDLTATPTPEPASWGLICAGALGLYASRRKVRG